MKVPVAERSFGLQGLPDVRQNLSVDADNFLGGTQRAALEGAVDASGAVNKAVQFHYANALEEANRTRVVDGAAALKQFKLDTLYGTPATDNAPATPGLFNVKGAAAFLGSGGKTVSDNAYDAVSARRQEIADGMANEVVRQKFLNHTALGLVDFRGQLLAYEAEQHRNYMQDTLDASNTVESNNIALNYNDTDGIQKSIAQIKANSAQLAALNGKPPLWGDVYAQSHVSGALNKVIDSALDEGRFATAQSVLKNFAPHMNTNDLATAYSKLQKAQGDATALGTAFAAIERLKPALMPSDGDRMENITVAGESANNHWGGDGQALTSAAGAKGRWQVLESTGPEAAKLAGLPWDKALFNQARTGDPEVDGKAERYNAALGRAYLREQMQANHGDMQKAWAAYNAGPAALKAAVAQGGADWLAFLPKETQDYVSQNMAAYNAGAGKPKAPTKEEAVYAAVNALPKGVSADVVKSTMQNTEHLFELHTQAVRQHEESVVAQVYTALSQNGGDMNAIPPSLKAQIPGDKLNALYDFADSQGKGPKHSDLAVYNHLTENPAFLAGLSPDQFVAYRRDLSEADWKALQNQRKSLLNPSAAESPDNVDAQTVNAVTNNLLSQLAIDTTPKDSDAAAKARLGTIRKYINDALLAQQAQLGKKFKDAEISRFITGLFAKDVQFKQTFLGFDAGTKRQPLLVTQADEIPSATRVAIVAAFKAHGIDQPTDGQILGSYFYGMGR